MPRNFREAGAGEMGIIDKSEKGGGVDIEKIKLENEIKAIRLEKNKKGLSNGRVKQLAGELKNLEAKLQELQSEKQLEIESTKRKLKLEKTEKKKKNEPEWWGERRKMQKEYIAEKKAKQVSGKEITERKIKDNDVSATNKDETLPVVEKMTEYPLKKKKVLVLGKEAILAPDEELVNDKQTIKEKREKVTKAYQENISQKPMAVQQKFTDNYVNNLEARQEMEELAKQPSPETLQEALEKNEEATKSAEEALLTYGEPLIEAQKQLIKKQEEEISEFATENAKLKEGLEGAKKVESKLAETERKLLELEGKLAAMEAKNAKNAEIFEKARKEYGINDVEAKNKTTTEKLKDFVDKNPKLTTMIALGILGGFGVGVLGTTPLYFAAKEIILATTGKTIFVSAMGGLSTPLYLAAGGGALHWFSEKIGLIKNKKGAKEILEELLENKKQPSSESRPSAETLTKPLSEIPLKESIGVLGAENVFENQKTDAISIETARKYFEENKAKSNNELNLEEIKKMMKAIMPGTTKNLIKFLVSKEKRRNNDIYDWLYKKKKEIEKAQEEKDEEKPDMEQASGDKKEPIEITERMEKTAPETETSEEATRENNKQPEKANEIDVIEGLDSAKELTPGEKEEMRKIAGGNKIDIISPSAEVKEDDKLEFGEVVRKEIKIDRRPPRESLESPGEILETETEKIKDFIQDFREKNRTGKEAFELAKHLIDLEKTYKDKYWEVVGNFIKKEIYPKDQVFFLDAVIDYLRENNLEKEWSSINTNLDAVIIGGDYKLYITYMKKENAEWLRNHKGRRWLE